VIKKLFKLQQGMRLFFMVYDANNKLQMVSTSSSDLYKLNTQFAYGINVHNNRYPRFYKPDELDKLKSDFVNSSAKLVYLDIRSNKWCKL